MKSKFFLTIGLFLMSVLSGFAQSKVDMAFDLRSSGKIYVVVLVLLVIFAGVAFYLFLLDKKISRLEKEEKQRSH